MILKLKFIFIINGLIVNRAGRHGTAPSALALVLVVVLGYAGRAAWAQSQTASDSTQTATPGASNATGSGSAPGDASADPESMLPHFRSTRFWVSGQANFIFQTHPDFHADYSGPHSLSPNYEKATSRVMTLYTGVRLNNSTEILVDIEEAGGEECSRQWSRPTAHSLRHAPRRLARAMRRSAGGNRSGGEVTASREFRVA